MTRQKIRFGIIGLGLMGREFASAAARWCHLLDQGPVPVIAGICSRSRERWDWYTDNFPTIGVTTTDYRDLLASPDIDAVYCAVPHDLHETIYAGTLRAGKHLLGEKPFGIDIRANRVIVDEAKKRPDLVVRCVSQFPYYPGAKRVVDWIRSGVGGRIMEVKAGFLHSSDMDPHKPINWKRLAKTNGEYGCMGDLGMHVMHVPLRMGWVPETVYAVLQNIAETRPDATGAAVPSTTWDNATMLCSCTDQSCGKPFLMTLETKRMSPGQTNTWFIEVCGTEGSARFSTTEPSTFYTLKTEGKEQGWTRTDIGAASYLPTITPSIFETGFSDALQQMIGAYMCEFRDDSPEHPFPNASVRETALSHVVMTAALESHRTGRRVTVPKP